MKEEYIGPCSLDEALESAEEFMGVKIALSCPGNPLWIVICFRGGLRVCRVTNKVSGHGGSVIKTGRWVKPKDIPKTLSWRPG